MSTRGMANEPETENIGHSSAVQSRKASARTKHNADMKAVSGLMATPQGRGWIYGILERAYLFRSTFTGTSHGTFNEGMRNLGLGVLADVMEAAPEQYITMIEENKDGT